MIYSFQKKIDGNEGKYDLSVRRLKFFLVFFDEGSEAISSPELTSCRRNAGMFEMPEDINRRIEIEADSLAADM